MKPLSPALLSHGLVTTTWILLFPLQAWLISTGRRSWHLQLGKLGFALGAATTVTAYVVAMELYRNPTAPQFSPAVNVVLPLTDVATLCVLLPLAWVRRFDGQAHKRLMLVIACLLCGAAIFRLPFWNRDAIIGVVVIHVALFATLVPLDDSADGSVGRARGRVAWVRNAVAQPLKSRVHRGRVRWRRTAPRALSRRPRAG